VGRLAAKVGPAILRSDAPADIKRTAIDFSNEVLSAFFGADDELATCGLAESLAATVPYWSTGTSQPFPFNGTHIEWLIAHTRDWVSLPLQRRILRSATDYEFSRGRRVLHVAFGLIARVALQLPVDEHQGLQEHGRIAVAIFGRAALLPLIAILRDPSAPRFIPVLLRLGRGMKHGFRAS
jgi:hypothetical protein